MCDHEWRLVLTMHMPSGRCGAEFQPVANPRYFFWCECGEQLICPLNSATVKSLPEQYAVYYLWDDESVFSIISTT